MISIDTVYQKVLALANKEQRGYITPQEFNLFANQSQVEIFEQYFYDLNQFQRAHGNDTQFADIDDMLEEKMQIFSMVDNQSMVSTVWQNPTSDPNNQQREVPQYVYRIISVENSIGKECEIVSIKDFQRLRNANGLLKPSINRPVASINNKILQIWDGSNNYAAPGSVYYFQKPNKVHWGYVVVNSKAMYDPTNRVDFELHPSEESELINRILVLSGITLKQQDLVQSGITLETNKVQQEKQ